MRSMPSRQMIDDGRGKEVMLLRDAWYVIHGGSYLDICRALKYWGWRAHHMSGALHPRAPRNPPNLPAEGIAPRAGGPCEVGFIVKDCDMSMAGARSRDGDRHRLDSHA